MREISSNPPPIFNATETAIAKAVVVFAWWKTFPKEIFFAERKLPPISAVVVFAWWKTFPKEIFFAERKLPPISAVVVFRLAKNIPAGNIFLPDGIVALLFLFSFGQKISAKI